MLKLIKCILMSTVFVYPTKTSHFNNIQRLYRNRVICLRVRFVFEQRFSYFLLAVLHPTSSSIYLKKIVFCCTLIFKLVILCKFAAWAEKKTNHKNIKYSDMRFKRNSSHNTTIYSFVQVSAVK